MKRHLVVAVALACVMPYASAEVLVENDRQYVGDDDALHIVGEIRNGLGYTISQVSVSAVLFAEDGSKMGIADADSLIRTVSPAMKAPFDVIITDDRAADVAGYSLDLDYKVSAPKSQVIEIVSSELKRDGFNNLMIAGTVANKGEITANTISIAATLYDRYGNVAAVSRLQAEPDYLRSDGVAHFVMPIPDKVQAESVVGYALVAESEEYAAVPEFPVGSWLLLAGSVGAYIVLTRYPNRFIAGLVSAADPR